MMDNKENAARTLKESELERYFNAGHELLDVLREEIITSWQSEEFDFSKKEDTTLVSALDLRCENITREFLSRRFPTATIQGEEFGESGAGGEVSWTIDPIDGTEHLINRIPTFGVLLGLSINGVPLLGFVDHPVLGIRWSGGGGLGIYSGKEKISVASMTKERPTMLTSISPRASFAFMGMERVFDQIMIKFPKTRIYYDCFFLSLLASRGITAGFEVALAEWERVPIAAITQELGGDFFSFGFKEYGGVKYSNGIFGKKDIVAQLRQCLVFE